MSTGNGCPNCARLEKLVEQLQKQVAEQAARIEELERKLAAATKNSANSSKPPSSDPAAPSCYNRLLNAMFALDQAISIGREIVDIDPHQSKLT